MVEIYNILVFNTNFSPRLVIYSVTCQLLVVFPAVFDQFFGRFSKEDNSVGFKIFKILISGCWCFKSAQKIAPATVG